MLIEINDDKALDIIIRFELPVKIYVGLYSLPGQYDCTIIKIEPHIEFNWLAVELSNHTTFYQRTDYIHKIECEMFAAAGTKLWKLITR